MKKSTLRRTGRGMACPRSLHGRHKELWALYIEPCDWLVAPFDIIKADLVVRLKAECESGSLEAPKLALLRSLLTDIGHDPGSRLRIAGPDVRSVPTPASKFFDDIDNEEGAA